MKASELRIGNLILGARGYVKVSAILESGLIRIEGNSSFFGVEGSEPCLLPIPLTEEWLVKFGFTACDSLEDGYNSFEIPDWGRVRLLNGALEADEYSFLNGMTQYVFNVHQLQNLYHSLTGEELTIK